MKRKLNKIIIVLPIIIMMMIFITSCASSKKAQVPSSASTSQRTVQRQTPAAGVMVDIPYRRDRDGTVWSYQIFRPAVPADVPSNIYNALWEINLKTINAGKYDYNAFNNNTSRWITFDESALSPNFTFNGVCANFVDFFLFHLRRNSTLLDLLNREIITVSSSPTHRWLEYHTRNNRYIIDPTWCAWDYVGTPTGIYASNAEFAEACRTSYNRISLIEAKSRSWFFRNVNTVTSSFYRQAYGL
ncbi:MAG: hypothetical protein FWD47_14305 [Treponema sp.]|nr:hypothetical protein [Treponema sp.]